MIQLADLKQKLSFALGTSETNLYTDDKRENAINNAIEAILDMYPLPQYTNTVNLVFTLGVATLPSDCMRILKISDLNSQEPYRLINQNDFDNEINMTVTIRFNSATNLEELYCWPNVNQTLQLRYLQMPTRLTADADYCRFPQRWDKVIGEYAAYMLLESTRNYEAAASKEKNARDFMAKYWQIESSKYESAENLYLESAFSRTGLLGGRLAFSNSSNNMGNDQVAWISVGTTSQNMLGGYGYITLADTLTTLLLPVQCAVGEVIEISGQGLGGWKVAQNSGQYIRAGTVTSTVGTGGYIASTNYFDALRMVCTATNLEWTILAPTPSTISVT